ncbi:MAG: hypothetical protein ACK5Y2_08145 [Bdellovibrionales bacterium]
MSPRYVTAKRGTPDFHKLITGTFSPDERALPVQSLRIGRPDEEVTFEIVPLSQIQKVSALKILKSFLPLKKLLFVLFPLFYFVLRDWNRPLLSSAEVVLMLVGLIFALAAVQMTVDSEDFVSGYDRIRGSHGQRVLSEGHRSVFQLQKYVSLLLAAALACGLLPLLVEPLRILGFLVGAGFLIVGYKKGVTQKNRLLRDIFLGLIAGPCLAFGIVPQVESLAFGAVWAFFVFFELQIEHFQFFFAQAEAGEKNLMTLKSFDHAPRILWSVWGLSVLVYSAFRLQQSQMALWIGSVLILATLSRPWRRELLSLASPAGSQIDRACEKGHQLYLAFISLWVVELGFSAWMAPLVFSWFR